MLTSLWIAAALAAPPPGVDPDDLDRWEEGARALLDGPQACWNLEGTLRVHVAAYTPPSMFGRAEQHDYEYGGAFEGRIDAGRWRSFQYQLAPTGDSPDAKDLSVPVFPLVGRIDQDIVQRLDDDGKPVEAEQDDDAPGAEVDEDSMSLSIGSDGTQIDAGSEKAMNLLDTLLEEIDPVSTTSYGQWTDDPAGVSLYQDAPLTDKPRSESVTLVTFFPDGQDEPTRLDVGFPKRQKVGDGLVKVTLLDPQLHLRAQVVGDEVLPVLESTSAVFGFLGFTLGYEQKITYSAAEPCTSDPGSVQAED